MPKQKMIDLLYELMKNSKRSDRELAKVVKVSQPTITRMRKNLEKMEYIREYTIVPAVEKLGFELTALTF
ncbi:winged helix-turn-helix transcriptional regulator, partial [Candidatus Bathyarchaeota archaeon]|nr:winged helix-turn-helix transcriptional regulator [Candidatus Bathyarchaeota archaeon]